MDLQSVNPRNRGARALGSQLSSDTRGATIIEFAIVAAPLIALIIAILQTSIVFFSQQTLESAAEQASRLILTNQAQKAAMSQSAFKQQACKALPPYMKCANLIVDVRTAASFAAADTSMPTLHYDASGNVDNSWSYQLAGSEKITTMRLMYPLPVVSAPLGFKLSNIGGGKRLLIATAVFQPEPLS
ncbi:TadE/TadG family type IV pilus assembly protein [Sphingomonas aerophila]|jgi:Flp pilus assembly protein TadG|uniref:Flp pilus assembly protein TadG n=1 Tax=Sphingomonas aerophila TaxID=1344948 RepID=A0A7W9BBP3_9SPHN|nr:TadE/TadG family type IV pilus assembly protein [Sphingomonas aerophila]MBB5714279.1 Flp pilus assembly protein TadG [Sphingomonas aerophila]